MYIQFTSMPVGRSFVQQGLDWWLCTDILAWSYCGSYLQKRGSCLLWKLQAYFIACSWLQNICCKVGLVNAMSLFGIPYHFCSVVRGIYNGRHFMVRDGGVTSRQHPQCFGISQGCPLSPFLFSIVMTLLIQDAKAAFLSRRAQPEQGKLANWCMLMILWFW